MLQTGETSSCVTVTACDSNTETPTVREPTKTKARVGLI